MAAAGVAALALAFTFTGGGSRSAAAESTTGAAAGTSAVVPLGWDARYFNNTTLTGVPVLSRNDGATIDFVWPDAPAPGVNADYFSVRWSQTLNFDAGDYTFTATHDDGARLYVDGLPVIDAWFMQIPTTHTATVTLGAGAHTVQLDYYSTWGGAVAQLSYAPAGGTVTAPTDTPTAVPTATDTAPPPTATATLTATPVPPTSTATTASAQVAATSPAATSTPVPAWGWAWSSQPWRTWATSTPTATPVPTDTSAPTPVATDTHTPSPVATDTPAPAAVAVDTPTATSTLATDTPAPTSTTTLTPTNTPTPTAAATSTATPVTSPVATATAVAPASTPISTTTPTPTPQPPTSTPTVTAAAPTPTAAAATATPTPAPTATASAGTRDKYQWPFASTSIWNMPIGSGAVYVPAGILAATGWKNGAMTTDEELIGLDPSDPLQTLANGLQVHVPASMQHDGSWNGVTALLLSDGRTVAEGQPLLLSPGGSPSWAYDDGTVDLYGDGRAGAHGGSGLSSFGGSIRKGELNSAQPLHHALKVNLYAQRFLSCSNGGFRWPAYHADGYMDCTTYGGPVSATRMGSLLALRPAVNCDAVSSAHARKICHALQDYGAYVVDDTAWDVHAIDIEVGAEFSDGGTFDDELEVLFTQLNVVDNNSPSNVGGGGTPRVPLAPAIGN